MSVRTASLPRDSVSFSPSASSAPCPPAAAPPPAHPPQPTHRGDPRSGPPPTGAIARPRRRGSATRERPPRRATSGEGRAAAVPHLLPAPRSPLPTTSVSPPTGGAPPLRPLRSPLPKTGGGPPLRPLRRRSRKSPPHPRPGSPRRPLPVTAAPSAPRPPRSRGPPSEESRPGRHAHHPSLSPMGARIPVTVRRAPRHGVAPPRPALTPVTSVGRAGRNAAPRRAGLPRGSAAKDVGPLAPTAHRPG